MKTTTLPKNAKPRATATPARRLHSTIADLLRLPEILPDANGHFG